MSFGYGLGLYSLIVGKAYDRWSGKVITGARARWGGVVVLGFCVLFTLLWLQRHTQFPGPGRSDRGL